MASDRTHTARVHHRLCGICESTSSFMFS
jgi:hypothetical protein